MLAKSDCTGRRAGCIAAVLAVLAVTQLGCTTSVAGRGIPAPGQPLSSALPTKVVPPKAKPPLSAHELLLQDGDPTPLGPAAMTEIGDSYFTSVWPPECSAALLFKGSPRTHAVHG